MYGPNQTGAAAKCDARPNPVGVPVSLTDSLFAEMSTRQSATYELIAELERKIGMVLAPASDSPNKDSAEPGYQTELHCALQGRIQHSGYINARIQSLIERVVP